MVGEVSLDEAADGFSSLEKELAKRQAKTTRQGEDILRLRDLHRVWMRDYRPRFVEVLGEHPAIEEIDGDLHWVMERVGTQIPIDQLRKRLRSIARMVTGVLLPAYEAARWTMATAPDAALLPPSSQPAEDSISQRLAAVSPALEASYRQAVADLADESRASYLGPAGEFREVLRATIHLLTPDDNEIQGQSWFKGDDKGAPTQAERIRHILVSGSGSARSAAEAAELVETMVGVIGRELYKRASKAFHAGTEKDEVERIHRYTVAVLGDILPA
jgi:hypothetical protein